MSNTDGSDDCTCLACGLGFQIDDGKEPCDYCYNCVYDVVDQLQARLTDLIEASSAVHSFLLFIGNEGSPQEVNLRAALSRAKWE